jgi:hypothetical protein
MSEPAGQSEDKNSCHLLVGVRYAAGSRRGRRAGEDLLSTRRPAISGRMPIDLFRLRLRKNRLYFCNGEDERSDIGGPNSERVPIKQSNCQ